MSWFPTRYANTVLRSPGADRHVAATRAKSRSTLPAAFALCGLLPVAGSTLAADCADGPYGLPGPAEPDQIGRWSNVHAWPRQATHATVLPTGNVLWWRLGQPTKTYIWDPIIDMHVSMHSVATDIFCAGHSTLADGRILVVGGTLTAGQVYGVPDTNVFDPLTNTWTRVADMAESRWYPTSTTLPNGNVLAVSGKKVDGTISIIPEVYDVATDTWSSILSASLLLPTYPFNFVLPDGQIINAGPASITRVLNIRSGLWSDVESARHLSAAAGSAAMYRPGKLLRIGGGDPATNEVDVLDMTAASPAWREVTPMTYARRRPDLVILPDGKMLAVGGSIEDQDDPACAVHAAEVWDPGSESWTVLASMERPRIYHSIAILLPSGRVLAAGGENTVTGGENNAEIFSPPYLYNGARPTIQSAPKLLDYNAHFDIVVSKRDAINSIALLRPGSVTHNFDQNQRYVPLTFERGPGKDRLHVTAPLNGNLAPPGTYMMFVVSAIGVPSEAHFVSIGAACQVTEDPEMSCKDGLDNDCDGFVDDNDTDCQSEVCFGGSLCTSEEHIAAIQ